MPGRPRARPCGRVLHDAKHRARGSLKSVVIVTFVANHALATASDNDSRSQRIAAEVDREGCIKGPILGVHDRRANEENRTIASFMRNTVSILWSSSCRPGDRYGMLSTCHADAHGQTVANLLVIIARPERTLL